MQTKFIEAHGNGLNWGKFMVARFDDDEWTRPSKIDAVRATSGWSLLGQIGWGREHIFVFDLQTCEGAGFAPGGHAHNDLDKHRIWVCPLFEPLLEWLYTQDVSDLDALPDTVELPNAPAAFAGYRRAGPNISIAYGEVGPHHAPIDIGCGDPHCVICSSQ